MPLYDVLGCICEPPPLFQITNIKYLKSQYFDFNVLKILFIT
ncbi:hypothetical protein PSOL_05640 [Candidatus Phytoplasma solani]